MNIFIGNNNLSLETTSTFDLIGPKAAFCYYLLLLHPTFRAMYLLAVWSSLEFADYKMSLYRSSSRFITFSIKNFNFCGIIYSYSVTL